MLWQSPFACGIDGYYYALQVKTLLTTGGFWLPDSSPVLWLLAGIGALGRETVAALKTGAALLAALPVIPAFLSGRLVGQTRFAGFLAALLVGGSVSLSYLSIELFKNLGAVSLLLFAVYFMLRIEREGVRPGLLLPGLFFLAAALLAHRTTAIPGLVLAGGLVFAKLRLPLRKKLLLTGAGLAVAAGALLLLRALHPADLARFSGALSLVPTLPLLDVQARFLFPPALLVELTALALVPWGLFLLRRQLQGAVLRLLWVLLFVFFLPFWKMEGAGMGFRLALAGAPFALLLLALALSRAAAARSRGVRAGLLAAAALPLLFSYSAYRPEGDPPYARYEKLLRGFQLPAGSVLICHRGLNLFYSYRTGNEGVSYIPDYPIARERLWRLAAHVDGSALARAAGREPALVRPLLWPYVLVREDVWRRWRAGLSVEERSFTENSWNPYLKKPWYLRVQQGR